MTMKTELFEVKSIMPTFKYRGAMFKNVKVHWFVTDRETPAVDPKSWIDFEKAADIRYSLSAVDELFFKDEAEKLMAYLKEFHEEDMPIINPASDIPHNVLPLRAMVVGGLSGFVDLDEDYELPFEVTGWFTVEGCEQIETPPSIPKTPPCRPWWPRLNNAESEIPDLIKLPGMEHARFDLLEYKQNGFEARLDAMNDAIADTVNYLDTRLNEVNDAIADTVNYADSRINKLEARLDALSERLAIWEQWAANQEKRVDDALEFVAEQTARPC